MLVQQLLENQSMIYTKTKIPCLVSQYLFIPSQVGIDHLNNPTNRCSDRSKVIDLTNSFLTDGKPPLANKSKPPQSTKLRLDTPELTPRGKPPQSGGLQYVTPLGRSSHQGLFTPGAHSPGFVSLNPPTTPHGKNLLQKTLANMNLPPEDWVDEMKDLNGQLIEW